MGGRWGAAYGAIEERIEASLMQRRALRPNEVLTEVGDISRSMTGGSQSGTISFKGAEARGVL
eukprot:1283889-Pyramimonas_sp.AAC.1